MTNDLEDKLDSILYEFDSHNPDVYSAKQQIRQAFIDAGWEHTGKDRYVGYYTGQEWYERFNKEVEIVTKSLPELVKLNNDAGLNKEALMSLVGSELDRAAKRASGLE